MIDDSLTPRAFETLERLSNLLRAQEREGGAEVGLHPVHLQALWFLGRANRYSDTPASVADYLGITRGAASTSIRVLRERDLVHERRDPDDGRVSRLSLSDAGRALLARELPPRVFENAIAACPQPGLIRVACRNAILDDQPAVEINIDDNGPGIDPAERDKVR